MSLLIVLKPGLSIHRGARRCCGVDIGSADHLTNCLCVARIVLLALDVLSRRHQTYSMAERLGAVSSKVCRDSRGRACGPAWISPLSSTLPWGSVDIPTSS